MPVDTMTLNPIPANSCSSAVKVNLHSHEEWPNLAPRWGDLANQCHSSVFLSREWTGVWLEIFGRDLGTRILTVEVGDLLIGACLISQAKSEFLPIKKLTLNASGEPQCATTYIEYNEVLCRPGSGTAVTEALAIQFREMDWDELALDGFIPGASHRAIGAAFASLDRSDVRHPSYYVDLAAIRGAGEKYEAVLSSGTRKHLRQKIRYCAEAGELRFVAAGDTGTALDWLAKMALASCARSESLGRRSVFLAQPFVNFHRRMIEQHLESGLVQMLHLTAGGETVGIVYNLVHRGRVYFYQCGYRYTSDRRLSPGMVTLSFALQHCLEAGLDDFDFLSGEAKYKQSMSTASRELVWTVFRRRTLSNAILSGLRRVRRHMEEHRE